MTSQEKYQYWSSLVEQQKQSGISITQFCAERDISYQTFYTWAKKMPNTARATANPAHSFDRCIR